MKPVINSHLDYRRFLNSTGEMYRINWKSNPPAIREIYFASENLISQLWIASFAQRLSPDLLLLCQHNPHR